MKTIYIALVLIVVLAILAWLFYNYVPVVRSSYPSHEWITLRQYMFEKDVFADPASLPPGLQPKSSELPTDANLPYYGPELSFEEGKPINLPDFVLTYIGTASQVTNGQHSDALLFQITHGSEEIVVHWSTEPAGFIIAGKKFTLSVPDPSKNILIITER